MAQKKKDENGEGEAPRLEKASLTYRIRRRDCSGAADAAKQAAARAEREKLRGAKVMSVEPRMRRYDVTVQYSRAPKEPKRGAA